MKLPRQSEKDIQAAIVSVLALNGAEVLEYGKPGGHRALAGALPVGHPDVLTIWPRGGNVYEKKDPPHIWLEVKRPSEKATPDQLAMHARLRQAGDPVYVVESVEEALAALRLEGIKLRTGAPPAGGEKGGEK